MIYRSLLLSFLTSFSFEYEIYLQDIDSYETECAEVINPSWTINKLDKVPFVVKRKATYFSALSLKNLLPSCEYQSGRLRLEASIKKEAHEVTREVGSQVNFGSIKTKPHDEMVDGQTSIYKVDDASQPYQEKIQNLFNSIATDNMRRRGIFHGILRQEVAMEQQAFNVMRDDLLSAHERSKVYRKRKIAARKREANENPTTNTTDTAAFFEAARRDDFEAVKRFVEEDKIPVDSVNFFDETCAHIAAASGNLQLVKYALRKDPTITDTSDSFGNTPLTLAVQNGHLDVVKCLVEDHNLSIYKPIKRRLGQPNVVHLAAEWGQLAVLKYFVEEKKANVNGTNGFREPMVFAAARRKRRDVIKYLLEERDADLTMTDINGDNILYMTVKEGDLVTMKYVLDEKKIDLDVNDRNKNGRTVLHLAAFFNNVPILSYLVEEKGANVSIADNKGQTPLHRAAHHNLFEACDYLIRHGASITVKDTQGKTPVEVAKNQTLIDQMTDASRLRLRRSVFPFQF